jgi:hypothetical protein
MPLRLAILALAALCACAAPRQREMGSFAPEPDSCLDTEAGRTYVQAVWRELQDEWILPKGIPADQEAEVIIVYDTRGDLSEVFVARDTDEALRASVEQTIANSELPPTPEEMRPCVANLRMSARFRNPTLAR